jgi:hypothetical protein
MNGLALRGSSGKSIGIGLCSSLGPHDPPQSPRGANFLGQTQQAAGRAQDRTRRTLKEAQRPAIERQWCCCGAHPEPLHMSQLLRVPALPAPPVRHTAHSACRIKPNQTLPLAPHAPPRRPSRTDGARLENQPRALRALVHLAVGDIGHLTPHSEMRTCLQ